jgi:site-specific DNA-methyltransferase (adenine-specific)
MTSHRIIQGDCIEGLRTLPDASVHCCVTSPPYWGLRDYGHDGQIGLEGTPTAYVERIVEVFREVRRVLRDDGTLWLNLGDSYAAARGGTSMPAETLAGGVSGRGDIVAKRGRESGYTPHRDPAAHGLKHKDLVGIPWRVAFALQADGWWLRQDIIWHKPNPMPESVRDRCTKAHEYVFLLTKSERYFYDAEAVSEAAICDRKPGRKITDTRETHGTGGGNAGINSLLARYHEGNAPTTRNRRSVWTITTKPYSGAHFAVMPPDLVEPCILAGCPEQCCPVCGAGYERITAKQKRFESGSGRSGNAIEGKQDLAASETNSTPDIRMGPVVSVQTLGWAPVCDCAASGTMPGTVLDPFAGSGTTLAVAAELGRSGIGCELNPEYIELASQRIAKSKAKMPLFVA